MQSLLHRLLYHLCITVLITYNRVSGQTVSDLVQTFSDDLEGIMCEGLRVGGSKCSNNLYGIQDFIDSFSTYFEESTATINASETAQIIIARLNDKLNERSSILRNLSSLIQSDCANFDASDIDFDDLYFAGNADRASNLPNDIAFNDVYGTEISLTASTYKLPNAVSYTNDMIQYDAKISQLLDDAMVNLYNKYCIDGDGVHEYCSMYYGTINGVFRQFPGVESAKEDSNYVDYDPRFKPWYASAVSGSGTTDIVILLDASAAMLSNNRMTLAKSAVTSVLNTMGPNTYINVIAFSDSLTKSCFGDDLVTATPRNIAQLSDFVDGLVPSGTTDFTAAFNAAFDTFYANPQTSRSCRKAILFLTHGDGDDVTDLVMTKNVNHDATIFSYTLGDDATPNVPKAVAEATGGIYSHISDNNADLITAMSSYYLYYSHGAPSSNTIVFSSPYLQNGTVLISMSQAVYIDDTYFAGVVGTDIALTSLSDAIGDVTIGHKSYTFVMNEESELLLHPLISSPSELFDTDNEYKPIYVDDAEPQEFIGSVKPQMLLRDKGYKSIAATVKLPAGNVVYHGYRTEFADLLYIYAGVGPSSLSIAVVVYTELTVDAPNIPAFGMKSTPTVECSAYDVDAQCVAPFNMYHRMDLFQDCSSAWLSDAEVLDGSDVTNTYYDLPVNAFYEGKLYSVKNPVYFLQAGLWEHEYNALNMDPECSELDELHALTNRELYDVTNLPYDGIRAEISDNVLNGIYSLTQLHQFWKPAVVKNDSIFSSIWFGQYQGLHISYPGKVFSATYNNLIRPWYQRAITYPDSFVWITPYLHATTGKLVTGGSAVISAPNRDYPYGVTSFAVEYASTFVSYYTSAMSSECDISSKKVCYLIDSSAFLLYYDGMEEDVADDDISIKFLGDFEPTLMQSLLDRGLFTSEENVNYGKDTNDNSYIVDEVAYRLNLEQFESASTSFEYNSGNYSVYAVAKTNLYVIHIEGYQKTTSYPTDCPDNAACSGVISPGCVMDDTGNECASATVAVCTEAETSIMTEEECTAAAADDINKCVLNLMISNLNDVQQVDICAAADEADQVCDGMTTKEQKGGLQTWIIVVIVIAVVVLVVASLVLYYVCCVDKAKRGRAYVPTAVSDDRAGATADQTEMGLVQ